MAVSVISENLRIFNAEQFKESVSETSNTKLYFTIGKSEAWANDASPLQANSSVASFNGIWDNMIGAKLITGNDIRHVVPRYDWSANTVYPAYDHCICSLQLFAANTPFYVLTSDWNVYKCIANNYGANSTTMPTSLSTTSTVQTADGYIWKYMYTVSASERLRFTTDQYIPVKTLTQDDNSLQWRVQANSVPGQVNYIKLTNGGLGYTNANTISITFVGDGTGLSANAQTNATNSLSNIVITNPGRDYTYVEVTISDTSGGSGANARAIISPPGGHGSDPLRELGGAYLMLNPRIMNNEDGKLPVGNEYRQVSIISDPYVFGTTNVASNSVISQLTILTLSGTSVDYVDDELVYQGASYETGSFRGRVYQWDSTNSIIKLTNTLGSPSATLLVGANSTASRFVSSVTNPELKKYSGQLLYINNITPIERSADQTEDFKITFQF